MRQQYSPRLFVSLVALALTTTLMADDPRTQPPAQPQPPTFNEQLGHADSETLSRMLIERKNLKASLSARKAGPQELVQIDDEITQLRERLTNVSRPAEDPDPAALVASNIAVFPRIAVVPQAAATVTARENKSTGGSVSSLATPLDSAGDVAAQARLTQPASLSVRQQAAETVLTSLADQMRLSFAINWNALQAAGVDRNTVVTERLEAVSGARLLQQVLTDLGGGNANLGYTVDDGVVVISTRDDLNSTKYQAVRIYDVRDLVGASTALYADPFLAEALQASKTQRLTDIIKNVVAPDTWRDNGGTIGSIMMFDGLLVINQSRDNHREIEQFLSHLRTMY